MKNNPGISGGRRGFLKNGLRSLFLGVLAGICGLLVKRKQRSAENDAACNLIVPCRECPELHNCMDPKALESKQSG